MSLQEILDHRRAVRHFDPKKPVDSTVVKKCIEQATLAPTSSNLQLWEAYHVSYRGPVESQTQQSVVQNVLSTGLSMLAPTSPKPSCQLHDKPPKVVS